MGDAVCRVYEQQAIRQVVGDVIRPGGLALTRHALSLAALPEGAPLLDVGCGVGATVALCREEFALRAVGLDLSMVLLREGQLHVPERPLLQAMAQHLPFATGRFAAVMAECSLSLAADWARALLELRRVLEPGGLAIISDIYAAAGATAPPPGSTLRCCLSGARSRSDIEGLLAAQGLTLLFWEDHTPALRQFAARLVWEHGSLASFWSCVGATESEVAAFPAQPGYFLLLARYVG